MTDRNSPESGSILQTGHGHSGTATSPDPDYSDMHGDQVSGEPQKRKPSFLREIIETALLALLIFVLVRTFVLNFKVDGRSMLPTFENGEMLLVNRNAYRTLDTWDIVDWIPGVDEREGIPLLDFGAPERGDVVVFTPPAPGEDKPYIKRVIGVAGDEIHVREDAVFVNGVRLDEGYIGGRDSICPLGWQNCGPLTVPDDTVYVMGDNRTNSEDSRYFGAVPVDNIIGKAWIVYWPIDGWGTVDHPEYPELAF
jgi:signal peptidase I